MESFVYCRVQHAAILCNRKRYILFNMYMILICYHIGTCLSAMQGREFAPRLG